MNHSGQAKAVIIFPAAVESLQFFHLLTREPLSHIRLKITRLQKTLLGLLESYRKCVQTVSCWCNNSEFSLWLSYFYSFLPCNVQSTPETCLIIHHCLLHASSIMDNTQDGKLHPLKEVVEMAAWRTGSTCHSRGRNQGTKMTASLKARSLMFSLHHQDPSPLCLSTCFASWHMSTAEALEPQMKLPGVKARAQFTPSPKFREIISTLVEKLCLNLANSFDTGGPLRIKLKFFSLWRIHMDMLVPSGQSPLFPTFSGPP